VRVKGLALEQLIASPDSLPNSCNFEISLEEAQNLMKEMLDE